jgi:hypothetical protein
MFEVVRDRRFGLVLNGVLMGAVFLFSLTTSIAGGPSVATPLVDAPAPGGPAVNARIAELEGEVALRPSGDSLAELAGIYLDQGQPGLAQAVVDRLPEDGNPRLDLVRSRVALGCGRVDEALSLARESMVACESVLVECPSWLYAKAVHQVSILEAMHDAGVTDPHDDPARANVAAANALREVKLVAAR